MQAHNTLYRNISFLSFNAALYENVTTECRNFRHGTKNLETWSELDGMLLLRKTRINGLLGRAARK